MWVVLRWKGRDRKTLHSLVPVGKEAAVVQGKLVSHVTYTVEGKRCTVIIQFHCKYASFVLQVWSSHFNKMLHKTGWKGQFPKLP